MLGLQHSWQAVHAEELEVICGAPEEDQEAQSRGLPGAEVS